MARSTTKTTKEATKTTKYKGEATSTTAAKTKAKPAPVPVTKPNTITRLELAQEVAKAVGSMMEITNRDAEAIVAEIIQSMIDTLKEGNEIEIRGFGSFRLRSRRARRGRNPKTGESVDVPAKRVVYFKMGKDLKLFLTQNS
ncbi:MAG: integration host factor subunit beta [Blastocatellia bacterium]|nr:integration host factor subunit beta [Blastocatellia bacterium]